MIEKFSVYGTLIRFNPADLVVAVVAGISFLGAGMIYFNKDLQARVHNLLYDSLSMFGVFGLGNKESLKFTPRASFYQHLNDHDKLYRKVM